MCNVQNRRLTGFGCNPTTRAALCVLFHPSIPLFDLERLHLALDQQHHLALWKATPKIANGQHVLLTHGTFSTKTVCEYLAHYLQNQGYTCWIFEWRNHGDSSRIGPDFDFETIAQEDCRIVLEYLLDKQGIERLHGITHSGGGICLSLALLAFPAYRQRFDSLTFFACQAFGAAYNWANYSKIVLGKYLTKMLGRTPVSKVGGEQDEYYPLMKQWFDWNLKGQLVGKGGEPYQAQLSAIQIPILSICGAGDRFIAPVEGCQRYLEAFDNPANCLLYCSVDNGFAEAYTHSRILRSQNAQRELYPRVLAWMQQHASVA